MGFSERDEVSDKKKYELVIAKAIETHQPDMFAAGSEEHLEVVLNALCQSAKSRIWLLSKRFNERIFSNRCTSAIEECGAKNCDIRILLTEKPKVLSDKLAKYMKIQTEVSEKKLPCMIIVDNDYFCIQLIESSAESLICYYKSSEAMKNHVLPMIAIFETVWNNL